MRFLFILFVTISCSSERPIAKEARILEIVNALPDKKGELRVENEDIIRTEIWKNPEVAETIIYKQGQMVSWTKENLKEKIITSRQYKLGKLFQYTEVNDGTTETLHFEEGKLVGKEVHRNGNSECYSYDSDSLAQKKTPRYCEEKFNTSP